MYVSMSNNTETNDMSQEEMLVSAYDQVGQQVFGERTDEDVTFFHV